MTIDLGSIRAVGWEVVTAADLTEAQVLTERGHFPVGLVFLAGIQGEGELRQLRSWLAGGQHVHWIALLPAAQQDDRALLELIGEYCWDYHTLPASLDRLRVVLGHAYGMARLYHLLSDRSPSDTAHEPLLGSSAEIRELRYSLGKVAGVDAPVLLCGESGTGKELAAHFIHLVSDRQNGPFVAVNCGALPATLIQSELFGHEKGAFTGAHRRHIGRLEAAHRGTIFLDEVGDLPLDLQVNLLRFLQEGTIERVGSTEPITLDVRVIAATHHDLGRALEEAKFREDLYYRLNVLQFTLPPLREREGDIELLAQYYLSEFTSAGPHNARGFSQEALRVLKSHTWPGNVRELMNRIQRAVVMSEHGLISPRDLGLDRRVGELNVVRLDTARAAAEKNAVCAALFHAQNNHSQAAEALGISRTTLYRLTRKHRLDL